MVQPPIEVILFDLGNVILPFSHYQIAEKLSDSLSERNLQDPQRYFPICLTLKRRGQRLRKREDIFYRIFRIPEGTYLHLSISFEEFTPIWNEIFTENLEVSEIIRSLKGKKRLGLISNTNPLHFDYALEKFPILRAFDKWILSHEVGFKKPAIEIFQMAMQWALVEPERILLIDDVKRYVEVAISLGIQGIHFVSAAQLQEELSKRLTGGSGKRF